jgi:hypothetical protein
MDLIPHLYIIRAMERSLLLLIRGLVLSVFTVSVILVMSLVSRVDFPVILLLHAPLATRLKKLSLCFGCLDACVRDCEQIGHRLGLPHGDHLHSLDVVDYIIENIDDLNVLHIQDSVPSIAEMFHVAPEVLIMHLPDGL